jgi:hypothetical protein
VNYSTTVPGVRAVSFRGAVTNNNRISADRIDKPVDGTQRQLGQDIRANSAEHATGALAKLAESRAEFAEGVLKPVSNLIPKITYETSVSQTLANLAMKHNGALTGFNNKLHGFAFGIMRPETGMIGEEHYDSSNSLTLKNLRKEHIGAAAGIKDIIKKYSDAAATSIGPPVAFVEPIKVYQHEIAEESSTNLLEDAQRLDMVA